MALQARAAGFNRLGVVAAPPVLFGERRKRNRRRIREDPTSKFFYARIVCHLTNEGAPQGITTDLVIVPVLPTSSVTVSVTL